MARNREARFWSWSYLAVILVVTFLLVMLPFPGRSGRMLSFDERLILWAAFFAPWSTWLGPAFMPGPRTEHDQIQPRRPFTGVPDKLALAKGSG